MGFFNKKKEAPGSAPEKKTTKKPWSLFASRRGKEAWDDMRKHIETIDPGDLRKELEAEAEHDTGMKIYIDSLKNKAQTEAQQDTAEAKAEIISTKRQAETTARSVNDAEMRADILAEADRLEKLHGRADTNQAELDKTLADDQRNSAPENTHDAQVENTETMSIAEEIIYMKKVQKMMDAGTLVNIKTKNISIIEGKIEGIVDRSKDDKPSLVSISYTNSHGRHKRDIKLSEFKISHTFPESDNVMVDMDQLRPDSADTSRTTDQTAQEKKEEEQRRLRKKKRRKKRIAKRSKEKADRLLLRKEEKKLQKEKEKKQEKKKKADQMITAETREPSEKEKLRQELDILSTELKTKFSDISIDIKSENNTIGLIIDYKEKEFTEIFFDLSPDKLANHSWYTHSWRGGAEGNSVHEAKEYITEQIKKIDTQNERADTKTETTSETEQFKEDLEAFAAKLKTGFSDISVSLESTKNSKNPHVLIKQKSSGLKIVKIIFSQGTKNLSTCQWWDKDTSNYGNGIDSLTKYIKTQTEAIDTTTETITEGETSETEKLTQELDALSAELQQAFPDISVSVNIPSDDTAILELKYGGHLLPTLFFDLSADELSKRSWFTTEDEDGERQGLDVAKQYITEQIKELQKELDSYEKETVKSKNAETEQKTEQPPAAETQNPKETLAQTIQEKISHTFATESMIDSTHLTLEQLQDIESHIDDYIAIAQKLAQAKKWNIKETPLYMMSQPADTIGSFELVDPSDTEPGFIGLFYNQDIAGLEKQVAAFIKTTPVAEKTPKESKTDIGTARTRTAESRTEMEAISSEVGESEVESKEAMSFDRVQQFFKNEGFQPKVLIDMGADKKPLDLEKEIASLDQKTLERLSDALRIFLTRGKYTPKEHKRSGIVEQKSQIHIVLTKDKKPPSVLPNNKIAVALQLGKDPNKVFENLRDFAIELENAHISKLAPQAESSPVDGMASISKELFKGFSGTSDISPTLDASKKELLKQKDYQEKLSQLIDWFGEALGVDKEDIEIKLGYKNDVIFEYSGKSGDSIIGDEAAELLIEPGKNSDAVKKEFGQSDYVFLNLPVTKNLDKLKAYLKKQILDRTNYNKNKKEQPQTTRPESDNVVELKPKGKLTRDLQIEIRRWFDVTSIIDPKIKVAELKAILKDKEKLGAIGELIQSFARKKDAHKIRVVMASSTEALKKIPEDPDKKYTIQILTTESAETLKKRKEMRSLYMASQPLEDAEFHDDKTLHPDQIQAVK